MAQLASHRSVITEIYIEPNKIDSLGNKYWFNKYGDIIKVDYSNLVQKILSASKEISNHAIRRSLSSADYITVSADFAEVLESLKNGQSIGISSRKIKNKKK